jgi:hypothetical protein
MTIKKKSSKRNHNRKSLKRRNLKRNQYGRGNGNGNCDYSKSNKNQIKSILIDFIYKLYDYILKRNSCFLSGTFIIEYTNNQCFENFIEYLKIYSKSRPFSKTHRFFIDNSIFGKNRQCNLDDNYTNDLTCNVIDNITSDGIQYEILLPNITFLCDPDCRINRYLTKCTSDKKEIKRVLLFYTFSYMNKKYIFFKLEAEQAISIGHAKSALDRYILKKKTKSPYIGRREDSYKDINKDAPTLSNYMKQTKEIYDNDYKNFNEFLDDLKFYNKNIRTGRELFISANMLKSIF